MALSLEYQAIYCERETVVTKLRLQLTAVVLLFAVLIARVAVKVEATSAGYELARERELTVELDMQRRELMLKRSLQLRHDVLAARAEHELKLGPLNPERATKVLY